MKRFSLMLMFLCCLALTYGQVAKTAHDAPFKVKSPDDHPFLPGSQAKGSGDIFWQTTFNWADPNEPRGWSLPQGWEIRDISDNGNAWTWRNDTVKGDFTSQPAPSFFVSGADGFIAVPMDEYNSRDGVVTAVNADTYIQTPPINCSAASSVVVKFSQYFRLCCSNYNLEMQVTNDGGVHWATYDIRFAVGGNLVTTEKYRNVEVNISDVAAGLSTIQIRFYMHGMKYYYWMIDDLKLAEAYENDIVMEDYWMDFDGGFDATINQINYWPLSQMGMPGPTSGTVGANYFKAAYLNNGTADAENTKLNLKILKNGIEIANEFSPGTTIWTLERDTQRIPNPFIATDFGDYQFDFTGITDNGDEVPVNNTASLHFTVNDTLSHRADFSAETSNSTGAWVGGGNAGDMVAVAYHLYKPAEINSITAYIANFVAAETPQFQFVLLKDIDGTPEEWLTSDVIDMDSSYRNSWVTLPLTKDGEAEFLEAGDYVVCVRMWGVRTDRPLGTCGMSVGRDLSTKFSGTPQFYAGDGTWHNLSGAPLFMIGFNINETGGPTQAPVTFNVDLTRHIVNAEFKPGTDKVEVIGFASSWNGTANLTDIDGDGIYTVTVEGLPVNKNLEYKYRVNGIEESYPTTGNLHRNYVIRYWNILNNQFNNGVTTGIPTQSFPSEFSIYPNPTTGKFTVSVVNSVESNLDITLVTMQGQVVYRNQVKSAVSHIETIDARLAKGIYFLSVNNGKEVKIQKVIIQ